MEFPLSEIFRAAVQYSRRNRGFIARRTGGPDAAARAAEPRVTREGNRATAVWRTPRDTTPREGGR